MRRVSVATTIQILVASLLGVVALPLSSASGRTGSLEETGPGGGVVQLGREERIDLFLEQAADSGFNGSVLIATEGGITLHKGYGGVDRQRTDPVTTATPFWIASISKQFAAAAILKLVEQGRLSLEP